MRVPDVDIDLFADATLDDTPRWYGALREAGAIVHLPRNGLYAVTRFDLVRAALRADAVLVSRYGVAANDVINGTPADTTLTSDGETHARRRAILTRPLRPDSLRDVRKRIDTAADTLVDRLIGESSFCGVRDFAAHLPVSIVSELVGLEESGREHMLDWAAATFNALGPMNDRTREALTRALGLIAYVRELTPERMRPGGWASGVFAEMEAGTLTPMEAAMMVVDYVAPSLDTTILATAHMLWRLGVTDGAFDALRDDPALAGSLVDETVRLSSPIREFTRFAETDHVTDDGTVPAGNRVAILYASANWDDRRYPNADRFVIDRNPRDHVGWGHGVHLCAGKHLARMEMEALALALACKVRRIEVGEPVALVNNVLQGFEALPARLVAA